MKQYVFLRFRRANFSNKNKKPRWIIAYALAMRISDKIREINKASTFIDINPLQKTPIKMEQSIKIEPTIKIEQPEEEQQQPEDEEQSQAEEDQEQAEEEEQHPKEEVERQQQSDEEEQQPEGHDDDDDNDEEDEEEDDVKITIEDAAPDYNLRAKQRQPQQAKSFANALDLDAQQPILDVDLNTLDEKPWRKPGADISDYFNYGFDEETWKLYCDKQKKMKLTVNELASTCEQATFKIPVMPTNEHSKYSPVRMIPTIVSSNNNNNNNNINTNTNEARFNNSAWGPSGGASNALGTGGVGPIQQAGAGGHGPGLGPMGVQIGSAIGHLASGVGGPPGELLMGGPEDKRLGGRRIERIDERMLDVARHMTSSDRGHREPERDLRDRDLRDLRDGRGGLELRDRERDLERGLDRERGDRDSRQETRSDLRHRIDRLKEGRDRDRDRDLDRDRDRDRDRGLERERSDKHKDRSEKSSSSSHHHHAEKSSSSRSEKSRSGDKSTREGRRERESSSSTSGKKRERSRDRERDKKRKRSR